MAKIIYKRIYQIHCLNPDGTINRLTRSRKEGAIRLAYKLFGTMLYKDVRIFPLTQRITR